MNWFEREAVKLAYGRLVSRMPGVLKFVRRWAALLSVIGLAAKTFLDASNHVSAGSTLDFLLKLANLTVTDPTVAASVTAGGLAIYKVVGLGLDAFRAGKASK